MGSINKAGAYVHKPRVASFTVKTVKGKREFTAVNERAHKLARKVGKRSKVTAKDLHEFKSYYKLRVYTDLKAGKMQPIKV